MRASRAPLRLSEISVMSPAHIGAVDVGSNSDFRSIEGPFAVLHGPPRYARRHWHLSTLVSAYHRRRRCISTAVGSHARSISRARQRSALRSHWLQEADSLSLPRSKSLARLDH